MKKLIAACLLITIGLSACKNKNAERETEKSIPTKDAFAKLNDEIAANPNRAELLFERGQIFIQRNVLNQAFTDLSKACELDSTNTEYLMVLADVAFKTYQIKKASDAFEKVVELEPKNKDAYLKLAELYFYVRGYQKSLLYSNEALKLDKNLVRAYYLRGFAYKEMGDKLVKGICGQVYGSVIPGYIGLEAGQSAFGDIYAWFKRVLSWPVEEIVAKSDLLDAETKQKLVEEALDKIIPVLTEQAAEVDPNQSTVFATDWMNGRRTPDASQLVMGTISGLTLGSTAPMIFRALVEASAFGSKAIADRFDQEGVKIDTIIGIGGISLKSPLVMQIMADVLNQPIKVARCEQTCAFGAAMFAAVVAGVYDKVEDAQKSMGQGFTEEYHPNPEMARFYEAKYREYRQLGELTEKAFYSTI